MIKRHVSAAEIARFGEGDVSRRKAVRISSHLAGCSRCAQVRDDLAMVPALLARTAAPPMPDHLATRIQTALITESARRASAEASLDIAAGAGLAAPAGSAGPAAGAGSTTGARSAGHARPERHAAGWSWPRIPGLSGPATRWVAAAAAAVLIAGGGSYLLATSTGSGSGANSSASSGSAAAPPRSVAGANAPVTPVQRGLGPQLSYQRAGQQSKFTPVTTDTNYVPGKLATQVQGTLTAYRQATAARSATGTVVPHATPDLGGTSSARGSPGARGAQPLRLGPFTAGALEGCVTRISAGAMVLLVDVANYQGSPAAVIVTGPAAGGPEQVSVVGTGCSASRSEVLTRTTLPAGG